MTYELVKTDFHHYVIQNEDTGESYGPFHRFDIKPLEKIVEKLNNMDKPVNQIVSNCGQIDDKTMNNLAYYCSMIFEMFLTVNWEYEKLGEGTTSHEIKAAGAETLAKKYRYNFQQLLMNLGYDKNIGDDFQE